MIEGVYNDLINGAGAKFDSSGTIDQSGGPGFSNAGKFNNSGTITFNANNDPGSFSNSGTLNNSGTIAVGYSPFTFNIFSNSGTINNSGMLTVAFVNFDVGGDSFSNSGKISNSGTLTISGGGITVGLPSVAFENSGTINNSGTLNNTDASILDNSGIIKNTGTLNNTDGSSLKNGGTLNNIGTIFNDSTSTLINSGTLKNAGTINNSGTFMNSGAVTISNSGLLTTSTNYTQTAGSTRVNGTLTATAGAIVDIEGGSLSGTGIIGSNVLMGGTIMPGDAPGTLTIMGNYEQTSTGMFDELIGPGAHSFLDVSGNATLDPGSMLAITLLNGFDPLGQTFEIMDYAALFGQFANGSSFWDDNFRWDVTYGPNQIDVTAVQAPEPGMMSLVMIGLAGLTCSYWRKRPRSLRTRHDCA